MVGIQRAMEGINTWLMFVGYGRSGHSFIGSSLDAHPNVCIAHEADAVRRSQSEFEDRKQLFEAMFAHNREIVASGRLTDNRWGKPYRQYIDGQLKEDLSKVTVIGNKNGAIETGSSRREFDERLKAFEAVLGDQVRVKFLCVLRNPFDVGLLSEGVFDLLQYISSEYRDRFLTLRHEDFISDPEHELSRVCRFLGVPVIDEHLRLVASKTFKKVHKARYKIDYSSAQISSLQHSIDQHSLFHGYRFDS